MPVTLWEMVKGWLDPRTQNKIEFISSGPDINKRLLEFVDPDVLPEAFGGKAPNMHQQNLRPHTDFVHIPRSSAVKKQIFVPANSKLIVESYTLENNSDISIKIYHQVLSPSATAENPTVFAHVHKHTHGGYETMSNHECGRITQSHPEFKLIAEKEIKIAHSSASTTPDVTGHHYVVPTRTIFEFTTGSSPEEFIVTWNNTAMFVTRPLTFNLVVEHHH